ncbi:Abhydrolase_6 domain-containing protein [Cephalotus follicularis]|uniref:Abhydrolase_6 domain-containing protein n=1 Tax=Cephalotus follicularis TaxID=3775 RepID=A0A1Q3CV14_CEPFO|nr:Abhydrolase_6 domain-containing protein [Cephalotus follicularis]
MLFTMAKCFSFTATRDRWFRYSFKNAGLKSSTTDFGDGTIMHCWVPKRHNSQNPTLLLIHGLGANAMWQWKAFISPLMANFNIYVPDLLFFGDSYTSRPERSEAFQARCLMGLMEAHGVRKMNVVGISYGGFVAYSLAAQFKDRVYKVVLCCAGVCLEEKDLKDGMFPVKSVDEAVDVLLPQKPEKIKELMRISFYKPPTTGVPSCLLTDYIDVMCTEYRQERSALIHALHKDRKLSDLPKITQPTLIIWGEHDKIFPPELAHRLKRHLGENAKLVFIKNAGHAINVEKPKELYKHLKSFLVDPLPPTMHGNHSNDYKAD